ncbi:CDP-glucose 4,6-dehydratase [Bacillus velezensis]|uniref:CDP-glucose 4,6-dehydratase n=1 Tax=Bacillus velezensis TaxID=492670 RepID=UPI0039AF5F8C
MEKLRTNNCCLGLVKINKYFWDKKKVLITGNTGFKGTWLSLLLKTLGAKIQGFSLPYHKEKRKLMFYDINASNLIQTNFGDIRNFKEINNAVQIFDPDVIFHLAAQPIVSESYKNPKKTFETNILGTLNILESIKSSSKKIIIINVSTDKVYLNENEKKSFKERDIIGGDDPYSTSKYCAEAIINSYMSSIFNNSSIKLNSVRAGNVLGGGDWAINRLVPDCMRSIFEGEKINIRQLESVRPWQHILDPLNGYLKLVEYLVTCQEFSNEESIMNFGPSKEYCNNVQYILEYIQKKTKKKINQISGTSSFKESKNLLINSDKAKKILNWKPKLNLECSLDLTIDWYTNYYKREKMLEYTLKQIDYFKELKL